MLLVTVTRLSRFALQMAPPRGELLPEKVLLVTLPRMPTFMMAPPAPPPSSVALLPEKVLLLTVRMVPTMLLKMAPPKGALLPEKVLLVTVSVPTLLMALPLLSEKVLLVTVRRASTFWMAPPAKSL